VPRELYSDQDEVRYLRDCQAWMSEIRAMAGETHTGQVFKGAVEVAGYGTLARDARNQIVIVSPDRDYSTVVDRAFLGTFDAMAFQRWVSSIDRSKLPTKIEVREGRQYAGDEKLGTLLESLHARQAEDAQNLTERRDGLIDNKGFRDPLVFQTHMQNRALQSMSFELERSRYIEEYHEANRLAEQIEQEEKQKSRADELGSKFYSG
jgi:hypothetical protein